RRADSSPHTRELDTGLLTPYSPLFPYTALFRSSTPHGPATPGPSRPAAGPGSWRRSRGSSCARPSAHGNPKPRRERPRGRPGPRSEEHTSELQSRENLVCRLLLEKKNDNKVY